MARPAPRKPDAKGALAALGVAVAALLLMALISLALDAVLAARLRPMLPAAASVTADRPVTLQATSRWECRALTGGMWFLPLRPQLNRLALPPGVAARPARGHCGGLGHAPVILSRTPG